MTIIQISILFTYLSINYDCLNFEEKIKNTISAYINTEFILEYFTKTQYRDVLLFLKTPFPEMYSLSCDF